LRSTRSHTFSLVTATRFWMKLSRGTLMLTSWVRTSYMRVVCSVYKLIPSGYEFVMQNCAFVPFSLLSVLISPHSDKGGDRICIFGRSCHQPPSPQPHLPLRLFSRRIYRTMVSLSNHYIDNLLHTVILSLAGMIHKIGLLPACNHQQVPFAYKMYTRPDELGWKESNAFKRAFSIHVDIEFVGVWYFLHPPFLHSHSQSLSGTPSTP